MQRFLFKKLVRDLIPELLASQGLNLATRVLSDHEYKEALLEKFSEELLELKNAQNPREIKEELADIYELVRASAESHNLTFSSIIEEADKKNKKKGSFVKRLYAEHLDLPVGHPAEDYYTQRAVCYPRVSITDQEKKSSEK